MLVGFGVSAGRGRFRYDSRTDSVSLHWPRGGDDDSYRHINWRVSAISRGHGVLTDTNRLANSTWHPLGGAPMSSLCDLDGRVQGRRGLYVLDGALTVENPATQDAAPASEAR